VAKLQHIHTNFTSGEISDQILGRVDVSKYANGAYLMRDFIATPYGGAVRKPGTRYVDEVRDSSEACRLIPFQFSTAQTYMLCLNDGYIRFFRNQGLILEASTAITNITQANPGVVTAAGHGLSNGEYVYITGVAGMTEVNGTEFKVAGVAGANFNLTHRNTGANVDTSAYTAYTSGGTVARIYEITHPYAEADLPLIQYAQTADIMYLVHPDYTPRKLSRTGHTSWTLTTIDPADFGDADGAGPYLPVNTSATTITMSADTVGAGRTMTASTAIFSSDHVGSIWRVGTGWAEVTAFVDTSNLTVEIFQATGPGAVTDWAEGAWSEVNGYPQAISFYEQRLGFAGTAEQPQTVWLSKTESYENMTAGTADDDALNYTIATEQANPIRWLAPGKILLLGTTGGVFSLSSGSNADPLTPTNVIVKRESTYGVAPIAPAKIGNYTYYAQRDTLIVREMAYNFQTDAFKADNITLLSEHITSASGIVEMAYQQSPMNLLLCVNGNGSLAIMTREVEQEVAAWTSHRQNSFSTDKYENVAVIPASTAVNGDEAWFVITRSVNGNTVRYVEFMEKFWRWGTDAMEDAFFVHSGLTYDGTPVTSVSGLDHLEGETVAILADGDIRTSQVVTDGAVTLASPATAASVIQVGLPYFSYLDLLRPPATTGIGSSQGQMQNINTVTVRVLDTSIYLHVGDSVTQEHATPEEHIGEWADIPDGLSLYSGDLIVPHNGGWDFDSYVSIYMHNPLPAHILAVMYELTVEEH